MPIPHKNYYVDRSAISLAGYVYKCPQEGRCGLCKETSSGTMCKGNEFDADELPSERWKGCWTRTNFSSEFCAPRDNGGDSSEQCQVRKRRLVKGEE